MRFPFWAKVDDDGTNLPKLLKTMVWVAGSTPEVGWAMAANHGGGYSYRLCPASSAITEECFQKTPLDFVGDTQWIQYDAYDPSNRTEIPAAQVSVGTVPAGSQWRRNPIPTCFNVYVGTLGPNFTCGPPMFQPPIPGFYGLGQSTCFGPALDMPREVPRATKSGPSTACRSRTLASLTGSRSPRTSRLAIMCSDSGGTLSRRRRSGRRVRM